MLLISQFLSSSSTLSSPDVNGWEISTKSLSRQIHDGSIFCAAFVAPLVGGAFQKYFSKLGAGWFFDTFTRSAINAASIRASASSSKDGKKMWL
jgi:hypothetical protein